jgi:hypothetical protein
MKTISMPRWERDAVNKYYSVNFSGEVQEKVVLPLIKQRNPDIFEKYYPKQITFAVNELKNKINDLKTTKADMIQKEKNISNYSL